MELIQGIQERRSIRKFKTEAISHELMQEIVDIATYAPSWKNTQIARYTVIDTPEMKQALSDDCMLDFAYNQKTANGAAAIVAVSMVKARSGYERDGSFSTTQGTHWESFDAGIATQTFCLAAHAKGLGTVIMGIFDENKVAQLLTLPEGQSVAALVAIGYADEAPAAPKRKPSAELLQFK